MNSLLISYDIPGNNPPSVYLPLIQKIKEYELWAKPLESVWIIKTLKNADVVRDELLFSSVPNLKVIVIDVTSSFWASFNISNRVTDWMKNNI